MRELKFRAWKIRPDGKAEHWTCPPFGYEKNADDVAFTVGAGHTMNIKEFIRDADIIEQYTGLNDKNGKEIYEGDIVDNGCSPICKIRWSEHFTAFEAVNEGNGYVSNIWYVARYGEVIGNIHENPELLERQK